MDENQNTLPALQTKVDESIKEQSTDTEYLLRLQKYSKLNNSKIEDAKLENHPFIKNTRYLPISFMEMALDRIYFGLWSTENYKTEVVMNEVVGIIELKVFNPVAKAWITRTGTAAIKIMTDAIPEDKVTKMTKQEMNKWHLDTNNKKPSALEAGGYASLKADCFKNAVQSLGKYFGRDVNRKFEDEYQNLIVDTNENIKKLRGILTKFINENQDTEEKQVIIDKVLDAEEVGENTEKFYLDILKKYFKYEPKK